MTCPNCQTACGENDRFCYRCGAPLQAAPPVKKGSHWVPALILLILSALGIGIFFATAKSPAASKSAPRVSSDTPWFTTKNGMLYFDESLYTGGGKLTVPSQVNGETVLGLADGCFENCESLTTVILPATLRTIGREAFSGCTSMRGIFIPESVTEIGQEAFSGCVKLEAICIPESVTQIGRGTFESCDKLFYIFYPGTYAAWCELFDEFITPYTGVYCADGSFRQG